MLDTAVAGRVVADGAALVVVGANDEVVVVLPTMATARAVVDGAIVTDCGAIVVVVAGLVVDVVVLGNDVGGVPTVMEKFANWRSAVFEILTSLIAETRNSRESPVFNPVTLAPIAVDTPSLTVDHSVDPAARMSTW